MNNAALGSLKRVDAFEFLHVLFLFGSGSNPTTGWRNWFQPAKDGANVYDFMQEKPSGAAGDVVMPFTVLNAFPGHGEDHVVIRELENGKVVEKHVPVRKPNVVEEAACLQLVPTAGLHQYLLAGVSQNAAEVTAAVGTTTYRHHLGSFDLPFACATWQNPTRSRHYDFTLVVETSTPQDIEGAVLDCLKTTAIAGALALLLTPIGWAAELPVLKALLAACLAQKLRNVLRVDIEVPSHCN